MAAAGTFTLQELGRVGGRAGGRPDGAEGERFEWTSDRAPADRSKGGARAIPHGPWNQPGKMRSKRTDYAGAKTPSEQVLGPMRLPQDFDGRWDDRYNFPGYAKKEKRRFEAMVNRGNLVRLSFQDTTYEVLIVAWSFGERHRAYIEYQFNCSVHDRTGNYTLADRSQKTTKGAAEAFDDANDVVEATATTNEEGLREAGLEAKMQSTVVDDTKTNLATTLGSRDALGDTLDQRELNVSGTNAVSPFRRLATQFRTMGNGAFSIINNLIAVRSDVELGARTALSVLAFEDWSRSMRFQSRVLMGISSQGANDMDERAEPNALRLYRPHGGESLYAISRRFYGTPHSWRLIADRNGLTDFLLTGDELLIIPERGRG